MKIKTKKSAIASTLTWITATIFIFLILTLYFIALEFIFMGKGKMSYKYSLQSDNGAAITQKMISFLESKPDAILERNMYDMLSSINLKDINSEQKKAFISAARSFLDEIGVGSQSRYSTIALAIVDPSIDPLTSYEPLIGYAFIHEFKYDPDSKSLIDCDPKYPNADAVQIIIKNNTKLVFCGGKR